MVVWLANAHGKSVVGPALPLYNYGWQIFVSVYAVLAIPIAISAFTVLSARKGAEFDAAAASATRATALASWLGAALLVGAAFPIGRAFPASWRVSVHGAGAGAADLRARPGRLRADRLPVPGAAG